MARVARVARLEDIFHFGFSILDFHFRFSTSNKRATRATRATIILLYIYLIYNNTIIGKEVYIFQYIHCIKIVARWVARLSTCHYYQHNYFILLSDSLRSGILSSFFYSNRKGNKRDSIQFRLRSGFQRGMPLSIQVGIALTNGPCTLGHTTQCRQTRPQAELIYALSGPSFFTHYTFCILNNQPHINI